MRPDAPPEDSPAGRRFRLPPASAVSWLLLGLLAYLPPLTSQPGLVAADTKQYLYLDPGRLTKGAAYMWDPTVGMGTVTHQNIGYLFPMGPWYWAVQSLGIPMWVGQRLWMGTLLFSAGLGARWCSRMLGLRGPGPMVAAVAYTATPFILDYIARISAILMPWAALGWMLGLVILAVKRGGWRYPALFALVVALVGGVNATSILLVGLAPVLWIVFEIWVNRSVTLSQAWSAVWRLGLLSVLVSLWWIAGLWAEGSYGLAILQYTETVPTVARTSLASEALRGLGYWFFYGQDKVQPWTTAALPYMQALWLLVLSFCVPAVAILVGCFARWRYRAFAVVLVVVATVAAVGTYPYKDPSPLGAVLKAGSTGSSIGLAMRSSNRVLPLLVLGLALLLGSGVTALWAARPWLGIGVGVVAVGLVLADVPAFWDGGLVAVNLARPSALPSYWTQAASYLDAQGDSTRVFGIPGEDFAAYRWGVTEDPVAPGLLTRPYVARQVVPQGEPNSVDLLEAIDGSIQDGVFDPASLAPLARLMSAGDVLVQNDLQYERYGLPQPRVLWRQLDPAPAGTTMAATFGPAQPTPVIKFPLVDEASLALPNRTPYPPSLAVLAVPGARPISRTESPQGALVVSGSGQGLVYAADAGLLAGNPTIFYSASLDQKPATLQHLLADGAELLVTDTNAKQAHRWGGLQDNLGYVEQKGETPLVADPSDAPLPLFPGQNPTAQTTSDLIGVKSVRASAYGNPVSYTPEDRPANAFDGNPATAWTVAAFSDAVGQRLEVQLDKPVTTGQITLLQPQGGSHNRHITKVRLTFDGGHSSVEENLGTSSLSGPGQTVTFPSRTFSQLDVTILATNRNGGRSKNLDGLSGVGFAEVGIPGVNLQQVIDMPTDLTTMAGASSGSHPLVYLMDRVRAPDTPPRTDPELDMTRSFTVPTARRFTVGGQARVSAKDSDALIDQDIGAPGPSPSSSADPVLFANSSTRLPGDRYARADAAVDGSSNTSWSAALAAQDGEWLEFGLARPLTFDHLNMQIVNDGRHSLPTRITVSTGSQSRTVNLPPLTVGRGRPQGSVSNVRVSFPALTGTQVRITIDAVKQLRTLDYYGGASGNQDILPVALAEAGLPGVSIAPPPTSIPTTCQSGLVSIDGHPVDITISGTSADALAGKPLSITPCGNSRDGVALSAGPHLVQTSPRLPSGFEVDQLWLASAAGGGAMATTAGGGLPAAPTHPTAPVAVKSQGRAGETLTLRPSSSADGQWLVLGQSLSSGWTATFQSSRSGARAVSLGAPQLIDGYANGWFIPSSEGAFGGTVKLAWAPQKVVWVALVASGAGLLLALVLAAWPRRRKTVPEQRWAAPEEWVPVQVSLLRYPGLRPLSRRAEVGLAVGAALIAALLTAWWAALVVAPLMALGLRKAGSRILFGPGAALVTLVIGAYMAAAQAFHGYLPNINWPGNFGPANSLGWAVVLLLLGDVLIEAARSRADAEGSP